jgi:hypothetical protein
MDFEWDMEGKSKGKKSGSRDEFEKPEYVPPEQEVKNKGKGTREGMSKGTSTSESTSKSKSTKGKKSAKDPKGTRRLRLPAYRVD